MVLILLLTYLTPAPPGDCPVCDSGGRLGAGGRAGVRYIYSGRDQ